MFGHMKDPADGTATLVSYVETNVVNEFDTVIIAQVVVQAEGLEPTAVEWTTGSATPSCRSSRATSGRCEWTARSRRT